MRLAERQGLLQGRRISSAQSLALEFLLLIDRRGEAERFVKDLRAMIVAAHPQSFSTLFPEWVDKDKAASEEMDKARRPDGSYDIDQIDDSKIDWAAASDEQTNEDLERWIAERISGSVSATELEDGGWL